MILLKRMLLLNWYRFGHQMIDFQMINYLTGQNAVGKSTLIDAMQIVMLGDTRPGFFNKAANDNSNRTLVGYLRGDVGEGGDNVRFLRDGRFTSHLAMEFFDDRRGDYITLGVVFECYSGDSGIEHKFYMDNREIPSHHWLDRQNRPYTSKDVKREIDAANSSRGRLKAGVFDRDKEYRQQFQRSMGDVNERYFKLFRKAVPFTPIRDIRDFITQFVCDQEAVDVTALQENIDQYNKLEKYLLQLRIRIKELEVIHGYQQKYDAEREQVLVFDYELIRLSEEQARRQRIDATNRLTDTLREIAEAEQRKQRFRAERDAVRRECDELRGNLQSNDVKRHIESLLDRIRELMEQVNENRRNAIELHKRLNGIATYWIEIIRRMPLRGNICFGENTLDESLHKASKQGEKLLDSLHGITALSPDEMMTQEGYWLLQAQEDFEEFHRLVNALESKLTDACVREKEQLRILEDQQIRLKSGLINYPPSAQRLRSALGARLNCEVNFFADLLELKDESWRNAIEGYLNHARMNLFLEKPEKYRSAAGIFKEVCDQTNEHRYRLVDAEKVQSEFRAPRKGSVAEELSSDHPGARAYVAYLLGATMEAQTASELNQYGQALTRLGETYSGYSLGSIRPQNWEYAYIGKNAVAHQLETIERKIIEAKKVLAVLENGQHGLSTFRRTADYSLDGPLESLERIQNGFQSIKDLETRRSQCETELNSLDKSAIERMEQRIEQLEQQFRWTDSEADRLGNEIGGMERDAKELRGTKIPQLYEEELRLRRSIEEDDRFTPEWIAGTGDPRVAKLIEAEDLPRLENVRSHRTRHSEAMDESRTKRNEARAVYNHQYSARFGISAESNDEYDEHLRLFSEVRLPEYEEQIRKARSQAYEQFRAGFLNQMKGSLDETYDSIRQINDALRSVPVGEIQQYRFLVEPSSNEPFKRYHAMIMDDILQSNQLGWDLFYEKYGQEVEALFTQIQKSGGGGLLDYKSYLSFDLEEVRKDGTRSRLSRSMGKKSGGETQTPFYIAVLASFAQLYGVNNPNYSKLRLIVFDEAFSKMDGIRIRQSIHLLRTFKLQAVLVAPPEKVSDISGLVDHNLAIVRQGDQTMARAFDWKEVEEKNGI